jgi:hypothetical protein
MEKQIKELPGHMGDTVTEWQVKDMHRRYPNTEVADDTVETDVWPTSRLAEQNTPRARRIVRAHKTQSRPTVARVKAGTKRPILRQELYEKLKERVEADANKFISWETD